MFSVTVQVPTATMLAINQQVAKTPRLMETAFRRATSRLKTRMIRELRHEPGKPVYPIRWKTERQRRAFFATNAWGRGIPTQRTHALSGGWNVDTRTALATGTMVVSNNVPYLRYVEGNDQQPFHSASGWLLATPIVQRYMTELDSVMTATWWTVSDPFAGIPQR